MRKFRMLNTIDEFGRQYLALVPLWRFRSNDVIDVLADLFIDHGPPQHIRSDNGPEFVVNVVREWLGRLGVTTLSDRAGQSIGERVHRELQRPPYATSCSTARSSTAWRRCEP